MLIAPDCFGETLTAVQAAAAISTGWHRSRPHDRLAIAPQSDGGPGFVAVLAGWTVTETGRQPFTVYGLLRTADSVSPLAAPAVTASLLAFAILYIAVFWMGTLYILRLMAAPPHRGEEGPSRDQPAHAAGITPAQAIATEARPS